MGTRLPLAAVHAVLPWGRWFWAQTWRVGVLSRSLSIRRANTVGPSLPSRQLSPNALAYRWSESFAQKSPAGPRVQACSWAAEHVRCSFQL